MYGSVKHNKIRQNEKKLKALHGTIMLFCTNPECHNKTKVNYKDAKSTYSCSKCMRGVLVREKELLKIQQKQKQKENEKKKES